MLCVLNFGVGFKQVLDGDEVELGENIFVHSTSAQSSASTHVLIFDRKTMYK